jgi:hypothetical protein
LERIVESKLSSPTFTASSSGGVIVHRAVEDRLAIFALADLEERAVGQAFDEIALRIDQEQADRPVADAPADQQRDIGAHVGGAETRAELGAGIGDRFAHELGGPEHRGLILHAAGGMPLFGWCEPFRQLAEHMLGHGQIARGQRQDQPVGAVR